jgi:hydroxymethylpyrimidine pyrophosphatase-like HAD family hydrolase
MMIVPMRFFVLATDYDGTIAHHGIVDAATRDALTLVRKSGRKLVLVTGRELVDLERVFTESELPPDLFDSVVAENGAVIYQPASKKTRLVAEPPPPAFAAALRARGVSPLSEGQVIVATWTPHENAVLETIRDLGLELQVIFNKGAVMVLPSGINKAVGLRAALDDLGLSSHNAVGVGDAENDHAFLSQCECAVAVANALPALKERADFVTSSDHGRGVQELAALLVDSDLSAIAGRLNRHALELGTVLEKTPDGDTAADGGGEGEKVQLLPDGPPILLAGTSGGGKSTLATGLLEQLIERGYQVCIIDPEGDYSELAGVTALGDAGHAPAQSEILELLSAPSRNAAVNLLGVPLGDRAAFFESLLAHLQEMRARLGRPHWVVIDEAHHVLPAGRPGALSLPRVFSGVLLVTVHPEHVAPSLLEEVGAVLVIGSSPRETLAAFTAAAGCALPQVPPDPLAPGEALMWLRGSPGAPIHFRARAPHAERRRHVRKYAAGELGPDKSFYFRGPEEKLNLRVQNLQLFMQIADGVDDDTWLFHLRHSDYSRWFREAIKDPDLAEAAEAVERDEDLDAAESRARLRAAIEKRYTAAA